MDAGACCRTGRETGFAAINTLVSYAIRSMSFIFFKTAVAFAEAMGIRCGQYVCL